MDRPTGARQQLPQHRVEIQAESRPKAGMRTSAHRRLIACVQCLICLLELAPWSLSIAPSPGLAEEDPELAYVVSPPPATRGLMPNYLPKLPPESATRGPQVAHGARRLRVVCRHCRHLRRRYAERCTRCRHRMERQAVSSRCHYGRHCANHRRAHRRQMRSRPHGLHRKAVIGPGEWGGDRIIRAAAFEIPPELFESPMTGAKTH